MKEVLKKIPVIGPFGRFVKNLPGNINKRIKRAEDIKRIQELRNQSPLKIVVGSSGVFDQGWIGTEQSFLDLTVESDWNTLFRESSIDAILAEHVWEHLSYEDGLNAAKLCFKYLKPGGYFRIAVPDGFHPSADYIDSVKIDGHGEGADDHKVLFTIDSLTKLLESAGFHVEPLEYFDKEKEFHFKQWDVTLGMIHRTSKHDERNADGQLNYTSLLVDAIKK